MFIYRQILYASFIWSSDSRKGQTSKNTWCNMIEWQRNSTISITIQNRSQKNSNKVRNSLKGTVPEGDHVVKDLFAISFYDIKHV